MEPPVSYPQTDSYEGKKIYGKKSGCAKFSCFGIIGAIFLIVIIGIAGYYFADDLWGTKKHTAYQIPDLAGNSK